MEQHQADAKKKRDEASQHPRSEMERINVRRVKAEKVESDREGESQRCYYDPPAQKRLVRSGFGPGQSLFRQRDRFPVAHIAQEGEKAKNHEEDAYDTNARDEVCKHNSSHIKSMELAILYQPHPCFLLGQKTILLLACVDAHAAIVGFNGELLSSTVNASNNLIAI